MRLIKALYDPHKFRHDPENPIEIVRAEDVVEMGGEELTDKMVSLDKDNFELFEEMKLPQIVEVSGVVIPKRSRQYIPSYRGSTGGSIEIVRYSINMEDHKISLGNFPEYSFLKDLTDENGMDFSEKELEGMLEQTGVFTFQGILTKGKKKPWLDVYAFGIKSAEPVFDPVYSKVTGHKFTEMITGDSIWKQTIQITYQHRRQRT
jgi:hypothetical protein